MTLCDFLSFANINNGENLQLPLDTQKQNKKHSDLGGGLCQPYHWGLAMEFKLCAVLN